MSLLPPTATFEELVQECFLAFRGSGLMLSPLDADLVAAWARLNIPYEVVARGIRKAAERAVWDARPGEPVLRSLRACRRQVEKEIERHTARSTGVSSGAEDPSRSAGELLQRFEISRHQKLKAALKVLSHSRPELAGAIERLGLGILARPPTSLTELSQRGDLVTVTLLRALPFLERLSLLRDARALVGDARMSLRARKLAQRFHRAVAVSQALKLPSLC